MMVLANRSSGYFLPVCFSGKRKSESPFFIDDPPGPYRTSLTDYITTLQAQYFVVLGHPKPLAVSSIAYHRTRIGRRRVGVAGLPHLLHGRIENREIPRTYRSACMMRGAWGRLLVRESSSTLSYFNPTIRT